MWATETRLFTSRLPQTLHLLLNSSQQEYMNTPAPDCAKFLHHPATAGLKDFWALCMNEFRGPSLFSALNSHFWWSNVSIYVQNTSATKSETQAAFSGPHADEQIAIALTRPCILHPCIPNACIKKHVRVSEFQWQGLRSLGFRRRTVWQTNTDLQYVVHEHGRLQPTSCNFRSTRTQAEGKPFFCLFPS